MEVEAPPAYEGSLVEGGTVLQNNDNNHNGMGQQQTRDMTPYFESLAPSAGSAASAGATATAGATTAASDTIPTPVEAMDAAATISITTMECDSSLSARRLSLEGQTYVSQVPPFENGALLDRKPSLVSSDDGSITSEENICQNAVTSSNRAQPVKGKAKTKGKTETKKRQLSVPCRICGDISSGFHYGVHSCEGCKGFFRRTLNKNLFSTYKVCEAATHCKIDYANRNKCQYCRFKKCLAIGMSQESVRFGRMPKKERARLELEMDESERRNPQRMAELRDLCEVVTGAMSSIVQQRPQPPRASRSVNPAATAAAAAAAGPGHFHGSLTLASTALGPQDPATAAQQYFYLPNPHFFPSGNPMDIENANFPSNFPPPPPPPPPPYGAQQNSALLGFPPPPPPSPGNNDLFANGQHWSNGPSINGSHHSQSINLNGAGNGPHINGASNGPHHPIPNGINGTQSLHLDAHGHVDAHVHGHADAHAHVLDPSNGQNWYNLPAEPVLSSANGSGGGNGDATSGEIDDPFMQFLASGGALNAQREPSQDVNRILNQYHQLVSDQIDSSTGFAPKVPGFNELSSEDQLLLIRYSGLEIAFVQMAPLVRRDEMLLSWDGSQWLPRATIQENQDLNQIFASKLEFSDRFNKMQLLQSEQALFCAVLLCFTRHGLQGGDEVEKMQRKLVDALAVEIRSNHPEQPAMLAHLLDSIRCLRTIVEEHLRIIKWRGQDDLITRYGIPYDVPCSSREDDLSQGSIHSQVQAPSSIPRPETKVEPAMISSEVPDTKMESPVRTNPAMAFELNQIAQLSPPIFPPNSTIQPFSSSSSSSTIPPFSSSSSSSTVPRFSSSSSSSSSTIPPFSMASSASTSQLSPSLGFPQNLTMSTATPNAINFGSQPSPPRQNHPNSSFQQPIEPSGSSAGPTASGSSRRQSTPNSSSTSSGSPELLQQPFCPMPPSPIQQHQSSSSSSTHLSHHQQQQHHQTQQQQPQTQTQAQSQPPQQQHHYQQLFDLLQQPQRHQQRNDPPSQQQHQQSGQQQSRDHQLNHPQTMQQHLQHPHGLIFHHLLQHHHQQQQPQQ